MSMLSVAMTRVSWVMVLLQTDLGHLECCWSVSRTFIDLQLIGELDASLGTADTGMCRASGLGAEAFAPLQLLEQFFQYENDVLHDRMSLALTLDLV